MKKLGLLATSITIALSGCGGSSKVGRDFTITRAGDPLYITTTVNGQEVLKETFRYYTLLESGQFVSTPVTGDENLPHIAFLESQALNALPLAVTNSALVKLTSDPQTPSIETIVIFTEDLVAAYRAYYNGISARDAAHQLGDFDRRIESIYTDFRTSGLNSLKDYVAFY